MKLNTKFKLLVITILCGLCLCTIFSCGDDYDEDNKTNEGLALYVNGVKTMPYGYYEDYAYSYDSKITFFSYWKNKEGVPTYAFDYDTEVEDPDAYGYSFEFQWHSTSINVGDVISSMDMKLLYNHHKNHCSYLVKSGTVKILSLGNPIIISFEDALFTPDPSDYEYTSDKENLLLNGKMQLVGIENDYQ